MREKKYGFEFRLPEPTARVGQGVSSFEFLLTGGYLSPFTFDLSPY